MAKYPVHEKLQSLKAKRETAQDLLDWLQANDFVICEWFASENWDEDSRYLPTHLSLPQIIGKFLGINPDALEAEKSEMLKAIRAANRRHEKKNESTNQKTRRHQVGRRAG